MTRARGPWLVAIVGSLLTGALQAQSDDSPRLSDEPVPLATDRVPDRPALLLVHIRRRQCARPGVEKATTPGGRW